MFWLKSNRVDFTSIYCLLARWSFNIKSYGSPDSSLLFSHSNDDILCALSSRSRCALTSSSPLFPIRARFLFAFSISKALYFLEISPASATISISFCMSRLAWFILLTMIFLVYFIDNDISKIFIFYVIASDYFHFGRYQIFYESEIFRFVIYKPEHKVFVI